MVKRRKIFIKHYTKRSGIKVRAHYRHIKKREKKKLKRYQYTIQYHQATVHHYDLRLQKPSNLKKAESWVIPKKPPKKIGPKRLALKMPDHSMKYARWSGVLPKGQYGAGRVSIWDKGTYSISGDKKHLIFHGKHLKGEYAFAPLRPEKGQYLFFKTKKAKKKKKYRTKSL